MGNIHLGTKTMSFECGRVGIAMLYAKEMNNEKPLFTSLPLRSLPPFGYAECRKPR